METIKEKVLSLYHDLETFLKNDEYIEDLRNELQASNPDYLTVLGKWRKDLEKSDHGIVVAGETSAGKSTLINKMLGMRLFKEHNLESTSTICKLRNSDTIRIITESMTGHTNEMDFTDTCDIKTKEGVKLLRNYLGQKTDITTSEESRQYRSVDIRLPIPFLKGNMALVDTPGIGGSGDYTKKLIEYLPNALAFVFVINAASAGGMQNDRLPEILREIRLLQLDNEMPCFDPKDVIFITNKWDCLEKKADGSDEDSSDDEETKTWNALKPMIKKIWESVEENHIFKLNLREVTRKESAVQFKEFKKVLDSIVKDAEINRVRQHLRFMEDIMVNISKGLRTRIALDKMTEKEQIALSNKQMKMIERLTVECKQVKRTLLERNTKTIEDITQECLDYMSTESGEYNILNPEGRTPIEEVNWLSNDFGKEIKHRVDLYVESYLQSDAVLHRFQNIKHELISFSNRAASTLFEMENEWVNDARFVQGDGSNIHPSLLHFAAGVFCTSLLIFGLGYNIYVSAALGVVVHLINTGIKTPTEIKNEYESCKKSVRQKLGLHLEKGFGLITRKMIDKVTEDNIPKRIESLKMLISQTSAKRDIYIAKQKSLTNIDVILAKMMDNLTKLQKDVNT